MNGKTRRSGLLAFAGFVCVLSPVTIAWLCQSYGGIAMVGESTYQSWPLTTVDALFWTDLLSSAVLVGMVRGPWRWVVAMVVLPLLVFTGIIAVFGGMWIEGTYL